MNLSGVEKCLRAQEVAFAAVLYSTKSINGDKLQQKLKAHHQRVNKLAKGLYGSDKDGDSDSEASSLSPSLRTRLRKRTNPFRSLSPPATRSRRRTYNESMPAQMTVLPADKPPSYSKEMKPAGGAKLFKASGTPVRVHRTKATERVVVDLVSDEDADGADDEDDDPLVKSSKIHKSKKARQNFKMMKDVMMSGGLGGKEEDQELFVQEGDGRPEVIALDKDGYEVYKGEREFENEWSKSQSPSSSQKRLSLEEKEEERKKSGGIGMGNAAKDIDTLMDDDVGGFIGVRNGKDDEDFEEALKAIVEETEDEREDAVQLAQLEESEVEPLNLTLRVEEEPLQRVVEETPEESDVLQVETPRKRLRSG